MTCSHVIDGDIFEEIDKTFKRMMSRVDGCMQDRTGDPSAVGREEDFAFNILHCAVMTDRVDAIQLLLQDTRLNVNAGDIYELTALQICARQGSIDAFKLLLSDARTDRTIVSCSGMHLLHRACNNPSTDILQHMLDIKEGDPNCVTPDSQTPLHLSVWRRLYSSVELLLQDLRTHFAPLNIHGQAPFRRTPFRGGASRHGEARGRLKHLAERWARRRFLDICIGLRGLDLPVLQVLCIIRMDSIQTGYSLFLPLLFVMWEWSKAVKHHCPQKRVDRT